MSKPNFVPSGLAVNKEIYLEKSIKIVLEPLIQRHYPQGKYVFWPDLASGHYSHVVQDFLKEKKIDYVPKWMNPAHVPRARPIEEYRKDWTIFVDMASE